MHVMDKLNQVICYQSTHVVFVAEAAWVCLLVCDVADELADRDRVTDGWVRLDRKLALVRAQRCTAQRRQAAAGLLWYTDLLTIQQI